MKTGMYVIFLDRHTSKEWPQGHGGTYYFGYKIGKKTFNGLIQVLFTFLLPWQNSTTKENLWKWEFILDYGSRAKSLSWHGNMAASFSHGSKGKKLRASILNYKHKGGRVSSKPLMEMSFLWCSSGKHIQAFVGLLCLISLQVSFVW